jgi:uncharacterized membrane protein YhaH (DUF805 family)
MGQFIDAWKSVVLQNYVNFSGRLSRGGYWRFIAVQFVIAIVLVILAQVSGIFLVVYVLFWLGTFLPSLGAAIRRMHDVDKSGWFMLIPIYNLILTLTAGTPGPNKYGPPTA